MFLVYEPREQMPMVVCSYRELGVTIRIEIEDSICVGQAATNAILHMQNVRRLRRACLKL